MTNFETECPKRSRVRSVSRRGRSSSAQTRSDLVREDIFNRAMALFEKKGFRGTSMREIADVCGVSKPAIYHYFKNKSEFLKNIYDFVTSEFYENAYQVYRSDRSPAEKINAIVRAQVLYSITHTRLQRVLFQERHELDAPQRRALAEQEKRYESLISQIILSGQEQGDFVRTDVLLTVMSILGLLSSVHRWVGSIDQEPPAIADSLSNFVMRSIRAPSQSAADGLSAPERKVIGPRS